MSLIIMQQHILQGNETAVFFFNFQMSIVRSTNAFNKT